MNKTITINGYNFSVDEKAKFFKITKDKPIKVGDVMIFDVYDLSFDPPRFVEKVENIADAEYIKILELA